MAEPTEPAEKRRFRFVPSTAASGEEEKPPAPAQGERRFRFVPSTAGSTTAKSEAPETPKAEEPIEVLPQRPEGAELVERTSPEPKEAKKPGLRDRLYEGYEKLWEKGKELAQESERRADDARRSVRLSPPPAPEDEKPKEEPKEGVVTLQKGVTREGRQEDVDVDVSGQTPLMKEVLTKWDSVSPLDWEGKEVPPENLQYPLLQFTEQPRFFQFEKQTEAFNLPEIASRMRSLVAKRELQRRGLTRPPQDKAEREAFFDEVNDKVNLEIGKATLPGFAFMDVDPEETSRKIAEGDHSIISQVLSRGLKGVLGEKFGEEAYEATWAPIEAVLTPATTVKMMDQQGPKQTQQHWAWHYLNASTGVLGSWWLSDDPDLDYGSPEHIQKIRSGYNLFDDYHKLGKKILDLEGLRQGHAITETVLGKKWATRNEQIAGFLGVMALDWGLLDLATGGVGKGARVLRVGARLGLGKVGELTTAKKAVDTLQKGIAEGTVTNFKQVSEALGGEASAARQYFYNTLSARVMEKDGTFLSSTLDNQLQGLPKLVAEAQKAEAVAKAARAGEGALQAQEAALKAQERVYRGAATISEGEWKKALGTQRVVEQLHPQANFKLSSADAMQALVDVTGDLAKVKAERVALFKKIGSKAPTPKQQSDLVDLTQREGREVLRHQLAQAQVQVSDAAKKTGHAYKAFKSAKAQLGAVQKKLKGPTDKLAKIAKKQTAAEAKAAEVVRRENFFPIARQILEEMSESFEAGIKAIDETPGIFTRFVDEPYRGILPKLTAKGADKAGTTLDPRAVRSALESAYGKKALDKFLAGDPTTLHRFLDSSPGQARLSPEVLAELHAAERTLAKQARGSMLTDQGLMIAQRVLDEAGELAIRQGTLSLVAPKTWKPAIQRNARQILKVIDDMTPGNLPLGRLGPMSKEMRGAYTRTVNWLLRSKDEQKALVDYALKEGIPFEEAAARYLDGGLELILPTGKSIVNRGPLSIPQMAFKAIRELPLTQGLVKGVDVGDAEIPGFVDALARMWLPDQSLGEEARLAGDVASRLRTSMAHIIEKGGDTLQWGGKNGFAAQMRLATVRALDGGAVAKQDNKSTLYGLQALTGAAMRYRLGEDIHKTIGSVSDDTARRMQLLMKGEGPGLAKSATELEDLYEKLAAYGMPTFAHRAIKQNFGEAREIAASIDGVIKRQTDAGELVFIPNPLLSALEAKQEKIIKTLAQYNPKAEASALGWGGRLLDGVMSVWRQDHVTGIGLARGAHFVMTAASDFSQMGMSLGWGTATRLSFQNGCTNLPFIGRRIQDFVSDMSKKYGDKHPIMATPLNAFMNPHLSAVWRNEDRLIQTASGEIINLKDVLRMATEDGVLETFYRFDQQEVVAKVTARLDKQRIWGVPGTGAARAAWSQAREIPSTMMSVVQQRQRMGVYLEYLVNRGAGRKGAKKAVDEALYDWTHGVSEWELASISKISAFYRYLRLSTNSVANIYSELLRAPSVESIGKVQRLRQTMTASIHGPQTREELFAASPRGDEYLNDEEQLEAFVTAESNMPRWVQGVGITSSVRKLDEKRRRHLARSQPGTTRLDPTHYVTRYPSLGTPEAFEMWLNIFNGIYGSMKLMGEPFGLSEGVPDEWYNETARPFTEIFLPGVQTGLEAGLDVTLGTDLGYQSKSLRRGEQILFDTVEDWVPSAFFRWAKDTAKVKENKYSGKTEIDPTLLALYRHMPIISTAVVRQAEAWGGAPDDATWAEEFGQVLQIFTGIKDVPYNPLAEHDNGVRGRKRALEEREKDMMGALGLQPKTDND